jgi:hypothetical protein
LGRVRSAWGVRSVARLRLFTESGGIPSTSFMRAFLLPFSGPFGGQGEDLEELTPVWSRKGFVPAPSGPFLFPSCFFSSPTFVFLFSGRKTADGGILGVELGGCRLDGYQGERSLFGWGKNFFFKGAELWSG